jgi:phage shock protein PspC (stress-responsive transcriptional regulator)
MLDPVSGRQTTRGVRDLAGVEETLRDLWSSRPTRPRRGRKVAGVAIGIARRYDVDPIVVRVAFVVAAFYGGAGIVAYLLGWLLLATEHDEGSPFESMVSERRSSTSIPITLVLCAALFPAVAWLFGDAYGVLGFLMLVAALVLLHRSRGHLVPPEPAPKAPETPPGPAATAGAELGFDSWHRAAEREQATDPSPAADTPRETPPSWDPLGVAPFAWNLPEPSAPEPEKRHDPEPRQRSRASMITLGAALVVGAGCVVAAPYASWLTPGHIIGVLLGVLGIGMVAGAFSGGGRGLILLTVPLSAAGVLLTLSPWDGQVEGIGEIMEYPTLIEEVLPSYHRTMGQVTLGLAGLPDSGVLPPVSVRVGTGAATVWIPETADVEVTCSVGTGAVDCLGRARDGMNSTVTLTDNGPDGPGGLRIRLEVHADLGTVEVTRA